MVKEECSGGTLKILGGISKYFSDPVIFHQNFHFFVPICQIPRLQSSWKIKKEYYIATSQIFSG